MKKEKNRFWKVIDFIYKHKVIAFLVAFTLATSFILYGVFANDDEFQNKLVVTNANVTRIEDGVAPFDAEAGDGKDTALDNGILRNYDSIGYEVSYKLELKEPDPSVTLVEGRTLIVDVIIPNSINTKLTSDNQAGDGMIESLNLGQNYKYFEFIIQSVQTTGTDPATLSFVLNNVNTKTPGATFAPVVLIKESTDELNKAISELTDEEKEAFDLSGYTNKVTCSLANCNTQMTGKYDYDVYIYRGTDVNNADTITNKTIPIGLAVVVPGLTGYYIPDSVSFNIGTEFDNTKLNVGYVENSFVNYKDPNKTYSFYFDTTEELPSITNTVSYENGVVTISNLKVETRAGHDFVGTAAFELSSTRLSESDKTNQDIAIKASNLKVGETVVKENGNSLTVTDYYQKFVGSFSSGITLFPGEDTSIENAFRMGSAFLAINQKFTMQETVSYATNGIGDDLNELDTYIKINPEAIIISDEGNSISESSSFGTLSYAHGYWTSDYFELTGETGCPTDITIFNNVEKVMNLYGGPCLREKDALVWGIDEEKPIIIVKAQFGDKDSDEDNAKTGLNSVITLNGKIVRNRNVYKHSYEISTMSTGLFGNQLYYLSPIVNNSDTTNSKNPDNFVKSVYDFDAKRMTSNQSNPCGVNNPLCSINGETIHVIGYNVNKPSVKAYFNDMERSTFYDYPIEWRIDGSVTKDEELIEFNKATVTVFVPNELNYLYAVINTGTVTEQLTPTSSEPSTYAGSAGTLYTYVVDESHIKNGKVDTISVFTDIYLNTKSYTRPTVAAYTEIDGYILDGTDIIGILDNRPGDYKTSSTEVTLINGSIVNTFGNAAPRYVEKDQSYTYTMKSYNNSSTIGVDNSGYAFTGSTLYYMLPYIEDANYKIYKKKFTNTSFKIRLAAISSDYTVYYSTDSAKDIVSDINNGTNPDSTTTWKAWANPTTDIEATAIKIVKNTPWDIDTYFYSEEGITVTVTPVKNAQADAYYNGFAISVDRPTGYAPDCVAEEATPECISSLSTKINYYSSKSLVEVYNRSISGIVFEDYNYSDIYENGEDLMKDIVVELYKLNNQSYNESSDPTNPNAYIDSSLDELVATATTDSNGAYTFNGLNPGFYYVLYRYDGLKYTPSNKYAGDDISKQYNSKAVAKNLVDNEAVSDIIALSAVSSDKAEYINLGLRIRKEFAVEINKYITNIVMTSNQGTKVFDYDKATKVNLDIKNIKNTRFRVTYSFDIVNTKYFPGYIGVVADLVPAGMTFDPTLEENKDWAIYDGILYYTGLQNKLLLPGDKQYFNLVLDLDTNQGGTYTNIVAAQQPILMGEESSDIDYSAITIENDNPVETSTGNQNGSGEGDQGGAQGGEQGGVQGNGQVGD